MSAQAKGTELLRRFRRAFEAEGDPEDAARMQRYMKSPLPFHGVKMPRVRALSRELLAGVELSDREEWEGAVRAIWEGARFREEWYAAVNLTGVRVARPFQTPEAMPLYEHLIVRAAWWDIVDELAAHRVGGLLRAHPGPMKTLLRRWSRDENLWKRRVAIISQVRSKEERDFALLIDCIEPSLSSKEFFLRKAVGWALREHARTDPAAVREWVRAHEASLSPLSRREALKHL